MKTIKKLLFLSVAALVFSSGLPVPQASAAVPAIQIIDNGDTEKVETVGDWQVSTWTGGGEFYAGNYIHDKNSSKGSKAVRYLPEITAGSHAVYVRYTKGSNRADNVPVLVSSGQGLVTKTVNQKQNGGKWVSLGAYDFTGTVDDYVEIRNAGTNGYVIADAVAFVELSQGAPCLPGLVSYWDFDQAEMVVVDQAGKNTAWVHGATPTGAVVNTGLQFDGSDSVVVSDSEDLRLTDTFTLCAWVMENAHAQHAKIVSRRNGDYFYFLGVDSGKPYAGVGDGDSYTVTSKTTSMPSNEWHHLAAVYQTNADNLKLYYDGHLIETVQVTENLPYREGISLSIGSDEAGTAMFFKGVIDELGIFSDALPPDQITALYMKGLAGNSYCAESLCGNGVLDPGEDCDGGGGCPSNCRYAGCYAASVVSYAPGLRKDGTPILGERSDPANALGAPQGNDSVNFVSLGFGGSLVLGFDSLIINRDGNDFRITETSYGEPSCASYPETARVYASSDGETWTDLGSGCLDSEYDLGPLVSARYIKVVDESDPAAFGSTDEGFDVDGIEVFACGDCNSTPVANDDAASTNINTQVLIDVLLNDTDADGDSLSISEIVQPENGTAVDSGAGEINYSPHFKFSGTDTFSYTISDGKGGVDTATVVVTVADNSPPTVAILASPDSIPTGSDSCLYWYSSNAETVVIDQGVGAVAQSSNQEPGFGKTVAPEKDTTYTITATGPGGTATDTVTVAVMPQPPVVEISAELETIFLGEGTQLFWHSDNAETVEINQEIGLVALSSSGANDNLIIYPEETITYTITATGQGGTATDSVTVSVTPLRPPSVRIVANPEEISLGQSTWLFWNTTDADTITIDQGIGPVGANGCYGADGEAHFSISDGECSEGRQVTPQATITYTITATGPGGTAMDSVTVIVNEPPPAVEMIAAPDTLPAGGSAWLYWHSGNADAVSIDQGIGKVGLNGCYGGEDDGFWDGAADDCGTGWMVTPQVTTTYTITATGPGGATEDTVTIHVADPAAPTVDMTVDRPEISPGETTWIQWQSTNATQVVIDQGIGVVALSSCQDAPQMPASLSDRILKELDRFFVPDVFAGELSDTACQEKIAVSPMVTTTYTVIAFGPGGMASDSVTVYVGEVPFPEVEINADPSEISPGESTYLNWRSSNATTVKIDQGIGVVALNSCNDVPSYPSSIPGSLLEMLNPFSVPDAFAGEASDTSCQEKIAVSPSITTTYTITATGPGGIVKSTVTVYVGEDPPPAVEIRAAPNDIFPGDTTWLEWESSGATTVTIDQGIGVVALSSCPFSLPSSVSEGSEAVLKRLSGAGRQAQDVSGTGCQERIAVSPPVTTTYTITATGPGGTTTHSVTVVVTGGNAPTADFHAEPSSVFLGGSTALRWVTTNADTVTIDQGIGEVALNSDAGGFPVSPDATTTYTLTATGPWGRGVVTVTVIVLDPLPPLVDLIAWPETVSLGEVSTLAWSSSNAETVTIEASSGAEIGDVSLNSGMEGIAVSPPTSATYTITAVGPGGTATDSVTVDVLPHIDLSTCRQPLEAGESCLLTVHTVNGDAVVIDHEVGVVDMSAGDAYHASGSVEVAPLETTTYSVTATGPGGTSVEPVTVEVAPGVDFYAEEEIVALGEAATLHWATVQADTVFLKPDVGAVAPNSPAGGFSVSPAETTTYVLEAEGPDRKTYRSVRVHVNDFSEAPAISTFQASPTTIAPGESATLTWETANMQQARIDQGIGDVPMFGDIDVSPDRTTTYTLVVEGPQGLSTSQVTVSVSGTWEYGSFGDRYGEHIPDGAVGTDADRFSVLTGFCTDSAGNPMPGVRVSILGKPGFGEAVTDSLGRYSLPVDGNNRYTLVMTKDGYLSAHRKTRVADNRIAVVDAAALIEPASVSTWIDFAGDTGRIFFHSGEAVSDTFGPRRLALTIPFSEAFADPGDIITTEYPGAVALPAPLPPNTSLAYAAEIEVQNENSGTEDLSFGQPATAWVENFMGFSVGQPVPVGWYDRNEGVWIPKNNGRVVRLLDTDNDGRVDGLDITGDQIPDDLDGDGDTADETAGLSSGNLDIDATYCRFQVDSTGAWALAWPYAAIDAPAPSPDKPTCDQDIQNSDESTLIEQDIAIPGTELFLHYSEARTPGYQPVVTIPVTGENVPDGVTAIRVRMTIAGRVFEETLPPEPEQIIRFTWDGRDYLGNEITGTTHADIAVVYVYDRNYAQAGSFAHAFGKAGSGDAGIPGREAYTAWYRNRIEINRFTTSEDFIAEGWTLSAQHLADSAGSATLQLGSGGLLSFEDELVSQAVFSCYARPVLSFDGRVRDFSKFTGIAVDDGSRELYVGDAVFDSVWNSSTDYPYDILEDRSLDYVGPIDMPYAFVGDMHGFEETEMLIDPAGLAVDHSGLYYAESGNHLVRKGRRGDRYAYFAGTGEEGYGGDGGPAMDAQFSYPSGIALDHWGNLYIVDRGNAVIRMVSSDGIVNTVAGNGAWGSDGDGGPALAALISPSGIAVDTAGNIFIVENDHYRVRKIDVSGIITTIAGTGVKGWSGIGGPASLAELDDPVSVSVDSLGRLYIGDHSLKEVDRDSIIRKRVFWGNEAPVNAGVMATDLQDNLYYNDVIKGNIYRGRRPLFSDMMAEDYCKFVDPDGQAYHFSDLGKHLFTGNPDAPTYAFVYNLDNLLVGVRNAAGDTILTIHRDATGKVTSLESSDGETVLNIDANHRLAGVIAPDGASATIGYGGEGILDDVASTFSSGSIQGVVTDSASGELIEGGVVELASPAGSSSCLTTSDGSYRFQNLEPGEYTLAFTHANYFSKAATCKVVFGNCRLTRDVALKAFCLPPEIVSFKAIPSIVVPGDAYTISWKANNVDYVEVWGADIDTPVRGEPSGSFQNTMGGGGAIFIEGHGPCGVDGPYFIDTFFSTFWGRISVEPGTIVSGETATVSWRSRGGDKVLLQRFALDEAGNFVVSESGRILPEEEIEVDDNGHLEVSPGRSVLYRIQVYDMDKLSVVSDDATLSVTGPPSIEIQATPDALSPGETAILTWTSVRADTVTIDNGIGAVGLSGSVEVSPGVTTTYTITATGPEGVATSSVTITVTGNPVVEIQAAPATLSPGETATLTWTSVRADTVMIDNGIGEVALNGSIQVSPDVTTIYTISATGLGGTTSATAIVTINHLPPTVRFEASPQVILSEQSTNLSWETTNATDVVISHVGSVDAEGTSTVTPDGMKTYMLTATGPGGTTTAQVKVFVYKGAQYDYGDPTSAEQAHLEALNRARLFPEEAAAELGIDLNEGLSPGTISPVSVQPLTFNAKLIQAAQFHTQDMMAQQYWTHESLDGKTPYDRIVDAGYACRYYAENLALSVGASPLDEDHMVLKAHNDLFLDEGVEGRGHRLNIMNGNFKEVGIGGCGGGYLTYPQTYMTTCDFGTSDWRQHSFLLGVVYDDLDMDGKYTIGEGIGGAEITIEGAYLKTMTASAGGYGVPVPPGNFTVKATLPNGFGATKTFNIYDENIKIDFIRSEFSAPPEVDLEASATIISEGESFVLSWSVTGADTVSLDNGIGTVIDNDSLPMTPSSTTTYILTAEGPGGKVAKSVTIYVIDPSAVPAATISVDPAAIVSGKTATLKWEAIDADTVNIDNGIGSVAPGGAIVISPASTTTYTLNASGPGGDTTASVTVAVTYPQPTARLSVDRPAANFGEAITLSWNTTGADTVTIAPGLGAVDATGLVTVSPSVTTEYVLTAEGPGGSAVSEVLVTVAHPAPDIEFQVEASAILSGDPGLLSWNVTGADTVSIDNGIGTVPAAGSITVTPDSTITYTLVATGPGGEASKAITLQVAAPTDPPVVAFYTSDDVILPGDATTLLWTVVNATTVVIDNGVGSMRGVGSVSVTPSQTTTYTLTATGLGGVTAESVVVSVSGIDITITSPAEGEVLETRDAMVQGTFANAHGNETGLVINGVPAAVYGNRFIANHVPLQEGKNTLTVRATDTTGDFNEASIGVAARLPEDYIRIVAFQETGIAPFETTLRVDGSFGFAAGLPTVVGPGTVDILATEENEFKISVSSEGLYYFTANVEKGEATYNDSVAVLVMSQIEIDLLLRNKWNEMKAALLSGDIEKALNYHQSSSQGQYSAIYNALGTDLSGMVQGMREISPVYFGDAYAKYRITQDHIVDDQSVTITYYVYFSRDEYGLWKIDKY